MFSVAWVQLILTETHSVGAIGAIQGSSLSSPFPRYEFGDLSGAAGSKVRERLALFGPNGREAGLDQIVSGEAFGLFARRDGVHNLW